MSRRSGRARRGVVRRAAALAAAVLALLMCIGATAAAQPPPSVNPAPPADPADLLCRQWPTHPMCGPGTEQPHLVPPGLQPPTAGTWQSTYSTRMDGLFNIDDGYGRTLSNYDIFDRPPTFDILPTVWKALANIGFWVGKISVGFTVWFTEWAMGGHVLGWIRGPAESLEQVWRTELLGTLRLREVALLVSSLYLGYLFLRGHTRRAWRELASTLVINILAVVVITHPVAFLLGDTTPGAGTSPIDGGLLTLTRTVGADLSTAIMGRVPSGNPAAGMTQAMIDSLLIAPWETLNYGEPISLDPRNPCVSTAKQALSAGPHADSESEFPRQIFAGCNPDYADYNATMTADRVGGAWAYAVAMILFAILTISLMAIQVLAPYLLLFEGMLLTAALLAALVPRYQSQLTHRVASIAATLGMVIAGMLFVAIMTVLLRTIMVADLGPQLVRFAVIDLTVFGGFAFRKRLAGQIQKMKVGVHRSLQRAGRRGRPIHPLPPQLKVPPGKTKLGALVAEHKGAFTQTLAPAGQLAARARTAGRTAGRVGATAAKYTLGGPVAWPLAAHAATTALTSKGKTLQGKLAQARGYGRTYAANVGKAASKVTSGTGLRVARAEAGTADGGIRRSAVSDRGRPSPPINPIAARIAALTPPSGAAIPTASSPAAVRTRPRPDRNVDSHPLPPIPSPGSTLPPGMLPPPTTAANRLRERFARTGRPASS